MEREEKLIIELTKEETTAYYDFLSETREYVLRTWPADELEEHCETLGSQAASPPVGPIGQIPVGRSTDRGDAPKETTTNPWVSMEGTKIQVGPRGPVNRRRNHR